MKPLRVGLLLPMSTIFPVAKDFEKGVKIGLQTAPNCTIEVELVKEFTGQGGTKMTEDAVNKLFNYADVDIVAGVLCSKVAEAIAGKFKKQRIPLLASDLGGYIPDGEQLNEYIFTNTYHLWQHAWTLGYWGVKTFGKKGMVIGAMYDTGYGFPALFYKGMMAADPQSEWSFSVPPMPEKGKLSNMDVIFPYLEQYQPDFVFAAFCGEETTLFLNEFIRRGWHKRTKLLSLPFLLSPFQPLNEDITVYTTLPDAAQPELTAEKTFYQLGYRTGAVIREVIDKKSDTDLQTTLLAHNYTLQHNGTSFLQRNQEQANQVTIVENKIAAHSETIETQTVTTLTALPVTDEQLPQIAKESLLGWMNPYLCI